MRRKKKLQVKKIQQIINTRRIKHLEKRLKERYGITEDGRTFLRFVKLGVYNQKFDVVYCCSNSTKVYRIPHQETFVYVVYSKSSRQIKTVLTEEQTKDLQENFGRGYFSKHDLL